MHGCVSVLVLAVDVMAESHQPEGGVFTGMVACVVQRCVSIAIFLVYLESGFVSKICDQITIVVHSSLVHQVYPVLVFGGQVHVQFFGHKDEEVVVRRASKMEGCPPIVGKGHCVEPVLQGFVDVDLHLLLSHGWLALALVHPVLLLQDEPAALLEVVN